MKSIFAILGNEFLIEHFSFLAAEFPNTEKPEEESRLNQGCPEGQELFDNEDTAPQKIII